MNTIQDKPKRSMMFAKRSLNIHTGLPQLTFAHVELHYDEIPPIGMEFGKLGILIDTREAGKPCLN